MPASPKNLTAQKKISGVLFFTFAFLLVGTSAAVVLCLTLGVGLQDISAYFSLNNPEKPNNRCSDNNIILPVWQGELPGPVIHVKQSVVVSGQTDVCSEGSNVECELLPGLYHPWSDKDLRFATIKGVEQLRSTDAFYSNKNRYPSGTVVEIHSYPSEGMCEFVIAEDKWEAPCPSSSTGGGFTLISGNTVKEKQFFQTTCQNGELAWIRVDDALFSSDAIAHGAIVEYGKIASEYRDQGLGK